MFVFIRKMVFFFFVFFGGKFLPIISGNFFIEHCYVLYVLCLL